MTKGQIESVWSDVHRMYVNSNPNYYPAAVARLREPFDMAIAALERVPEAATSVPAHGWRIYRDDKRKMHICHDDFTHDADLLLTGDFATEEQMQDFATEIARKLSAPSMNVGGASDGK